MAGRPVEVARQVTERAVRDVVRQTAGGQIADPLAAPREHLAAARQVELSARSVARKGVRTAREAGYSWQEIGTALGLVVGGADAVGDTVAEAAFHYAAGPDTSHWNRTYGPSVTWRCPSCNGLVSDRGPCNGPHDDEPGHARGCERLAAIVAAWEVSWAESGEGGRDE